MPRKKLLLSTLAAAAFLTGTPTWAATPFTFQEDDTVCLIGNSLPDRMQHDGWFETVLQSRLTDKKVRFRNLGFTGDMVADRPRNEGFPSPEEYLQICQADAIFAFFGYNESFAGEEGLSTFKKDLAEMIDRYRDLKPNGSSAPRLVLFSPIAHENLDNPNLPDGKANNARLEQYTAAIKAVADEKKTAFVDLFHPSLELYDNTEQPLTINGVHLTTEGNRRLAEIIGHALLKEKITASKDLALLHQAVLEKNWHWFNRYRATDGNDTWGGRSHLKFVKDQTNREVLMHELEMIDVMTANRDPVIWAAAEGVHLSVDDSNVPPPIPVISNIGGGSPSSSADKEGSPEYLSPEESLKTITVPEGYEVNVFASEEQFPEMVNPVQMSVDTKGRLWVAVWKTYPKWEPLKEMEDRILILPDDNRDGVADRAITFAKVHNPTGFEFWNGGVLVGSAPDIWFLKDTDGDDVADLRINMLGGIDSADTHHAMNNFQIGPDGGLYYQRGVFHVSHVETPWNKPHKSGASAMYRWNPRTFTFSLHAHNSPNPHGISFDRWGYHYATDGTGGNSYQVVPHEQGFRMRRLVEKEVRPVASSTVISSANFPEDVQQDFLLCNTIGYLGLKRYDLHRDGFDPEKVAASFEANWGAQAGDALQSYQNRDFYKELSETQTGEVFGLPTPDFLASTDRNFRPSDADFGSDGALYVADWHNVIIGHMQHNVRDPNRDKRHGRIFRMVYTDRPLQDPLAIDGQPIAKLLENLKHPIDGVRYRTRLELSEHPTQEVLQAAQALADTLDPNKAEEAHHLLELLWLHQQHNVRHDKLMAALQVSADPNVQEAARTVQHYWYNVDFTNGGGSLAVTEEEVAEVTVPEHLSGSQAELYRKGAEVFRREGHCSTCHQDTGAGLDPIYPTLIGSPWVTGSEERLIKLTLHGLYGHLEVNGKVYDPSKGIPPMTAFHALLNDEELAGVLTYVRNTWGNKAPAVAPQTVKEVREANRDRSIFWSPEELLKEHPLEES